MPIFSDIDRLQTAMKNGLMNAIKKDSTKLANQIASEINSLIEEAGGEGTASVQKTNNGATANASVEIPTNNAADFALRMDDIINKTFRFGQWSDMRIK